MRRAAYLPVLALATMPAAALAGSTLATGNAPEIPWFRLIFSLLLCVGIAVGAILLLRRYQQGGRSGLLEQLRIGDRRPPADHIRILEARKVSPTGRLCLIEFDGRQFLLSVTDQAINILVEKGVADVPAAGANP